MPKRSLRIILNQPCKWNVFSKTTNICNYARTLNSLLGVAIDMLFFLRNWTSMRTNSKEYETPQNTTLDKRKTTKSHHKTNRTILNVLKAHTEKQNNLNCLDE